ncbi:MAG: hypothetical protein ACK41T_00680 [Pseudobdellovibrio sp.]
MAKNNPFLNQQEQMANMEYQNSLLNYQIKQFELEKQKAQALAAKGLNPDGSPISPEFKSMLNSSGTLDEKYKLQDWQNVLPNSEALDIYKKTALRDANTNSPWAKLMLEKQQVEQQNAMDNAGQAAASSMLGAVTSLAQSGGVSGGARERMMSKASQAGNLAQAQAARNGQLDRFNILSQDETNRMNQLQTLQGMENNQADAMFRNAQQAQETNKYNTSNLLLETDRQRQFQQDQWKQKMESWAANKSADAQARASGGGGKK